MARPTPEPVNPAELVSLALGVIKADRFPSLATIDGKQPRVRPISPVRQDGFTIYIANLRAYHKTGEIAANPNVELAYRDERHDQVRITGVAEVVTDKALILDIWNSYPLLKQYLGTPENPAFILYRVTPKQVRFMREWALDYFDVPLA